MSEGPVLAIKYNNTDTNEPCAICGARADDPDVDPYTEVGPELFLDGTAALVCLDCGEKYAPEITACLRVWWASAEDTIIVRPAQEGRVVSFLED